MLSSIAISLKHARTPNVHSPEYMQHFEIVIDSFDFHEKREKMFARKKIDKLIHSEDTRRCPFGWCYFFSLSLIYFAIHIHFFRTTVAKHILLWCYMRTCFHVNHLFRSKTVFFFYSFTACKMTDGCIQCAKNGIGDRTQNDIRDEKWYELLKHLWHLWRASSFMHSRYDSNWIKYNQCDSK